MFERTENTFTAQRTWKGYVLKKRIKKEFREKRYTGGRYDSIYIRDIYTIPDCIKPIIKIYRTGNRAVLQEHKENVGRNTYFRARRDRDLMIFNRRFELMQKNK